MHVHYVDGWQREDDWGVVATEQASPVGAAWWRFFAGDDVGYGFAATEIPEITIGVVAASRGRGVGHQLLRALVQEAREQPLPGLSLSVSRENDAVRLYRQLGFQAVGTTGESRTMLLRLHAQPDVPPPRVLAPSAHCACTSAKPQR
jgi:GNAT superfamily N-acetyltransferase